MEIYGLLIKQICRNEMTERQDNGKDRQTDRQRERETDKEVVLKADV